MTQFNEPNQIGERQYSSEAQFELDRARKQIEELRAIPDYVADVREFMTMFGQERSIAAYCHFPPQKVQDLRERLITGEYEEWLRDWVDRNIYGIADNLIDLMVVIVGTALAYGIPLHECWREVHKANMAKWWTHEEIAKVKDDPEKAGWRVFPILRYPGVKTEDQFRYAVLDAGGKIRKPPSWKEPDIKGIIDRAMRIPEQEANRKRWNEALSPDLKSSQDLSNVAPLKDGAVLKITHTDEEDMPINPDVGEN